MKKHMSGLRVLFASVVALLLSSGCEVFFPPRAAGTDIQPIEGTDVDFAEDTYVLQQEYIDDHLLSVQEQDDGTLEYHFDSQPQAVWVSASFGARAFWEDLREGANVVIEGARRAT